MILTMEEEFSVSKTCPLLSICIPVYNGGDYIVTVMHALLSQSVSHRDRVEIVVADDASSDNTEHLIRSEFGCEIRYIRNSPNLGMSPNIVKCLTEHARGTYVWIWSQHCLLHPGALDRVVSAIQQHRELDAFYVNFNCANYPEDWPKSEEEAASPKFQYRCTDDTSSRQVPSWRKLLRRDSGYCTQTYAHILRASLARDYWHGTVVGRDFTNAKDTFAQSCTVAESVFNRPAFYIGEPVFTIYNGAQTWSSLEQRSRVYLMAFPDLVAIFQRHGLDGQELRDAQAYAASKALGVIAEMLVSPNAPNRSRIPRFLLKYGTYQGVLAGFVAIFVASKCNWLARLLYSVSSLSSRLYQYAFRNCRPARWYRGWRQGRSA
ncbi:MAG: glycosyltransferase family 2 protein [Planctomycetaceae bacterium]|nr:glycosyltransferase family 2 protein [Planctomycetaceae bacterium]